MVKTIGNNEQILEELKEEAKRLTLAKKASSAPVTLEIPSEEILDTRDVVPSHYFGHALVLVQGDYPKVIVTPTRVNQTYLELSSILGMTPLRKNMTLTQFRSSAKLDLTKNLK